ncbi:MAG: NAD(P)H-hydrate epimerase [Candidatus Orphnella occulta]|nr:NAD(P)H-hydrate epimerase [Candidatus Orphnella occulta]
MLRAVTSAQMKKIDKFTIEHGGVPSVILMERAGREVAKEVLSLARALKNKKKQVSVAIFCGKGNNGGDGLVCARYLLSKGIDLKIYLSCSSDQLTGGPFFNAQALKNQGVAINEVKTIHSLRRLKKIFDANIIVDSIFGIGFQGTPNNFYEEMIEFLNSWKAHIISVDVPSGLDATTGIARAAAIIADKTVTFGFTKKGFNKNDGPVYCGKVNVVDIGLKARVK